MPENMKRYDSDTSRGVGWVIAQGLLFIFFFTAVIFGDPITDIPGLVGAQVAGVAIALAGAGISLWAMVEHRWSVSPFPMPEDGAQLIDTGPYRYVRHPMYTGVILFTLGVGLAYANPIAVLSSVTFLVFFMAKTGREEEMLVERMEGYRAYRTSVPWSLIPFLM